GVLERLGRIAARHSCAATVRHSCCCTSCLWRDLTISDIDALLSLSRYEPLTTGSRIASVSLLSVTVDCLRTRTNSSSACRPRLTLRWTCLFIVSLLIFILTDSCLE